MDTIVERTADGVYFVTVGDQTRVLLAHATPDDLTAAINELQAQLAPPATALAPTGAGPQSMFARLQSLVSSLAAMLGG